MRRAAAAARSSIRKPLRAARLDATAAGRDRGGRRRGGSGGGGGGRAPQQQQQRRADSSLNMDELRELTELFTAHGLTDFEFENAEIRVRLSRNPAPQPGASAAASPATTTAAPATTAQAAPAAGTASAAAGAPATQAATTEASQASAEAAEDLHIITSPIVGTFYRAPSPQADVFVRAGSHVEPDTVVCIIEAMKLMNEIQAETTGTIAKIYVENGQPVEYGQPLFGVKK